MSDTKLILIHFKKIVDKLMLIESGAFLAHLLALVSTLNKNPRAVGEGIIMDSVTLLNNDPNCFFHFERLRLNKLFKEAVKYPLITVCAGAGYGKTSAIHGFVREYKAKTVWVQFSERDNVSTRFWESFVHAIAQVNIPFAEVSSKFGFPDTGDKLNQFFTIFRGFVKMKRCIIVLDDFHLIENPAVIRFIERYIMNIPSGTSVFLVSRSMLLINTTGLASKGKMFSISEKDLLFTENELYQYFRRLKIYLMPNNLREIIEDTGGWIFAINLIASSYQKAPGYGGYLRNAMKTNIFQLMETEIWDGISERLQYFLIRISLIDHLSVDLISILAKYDEELIAELEKQNAYVRRDNYINAYLIHHLFLEFLCQKQYLLSEEQKNETYMIAGDWCNKNGFKIDALTYYEKIEDYESIVSIFLELPIQVSSDIAHYAVKIFDRLQPEAFDKVDLLAAIHVRVVLSMGLWQKAFELAEYYEEKYLKLPDNNLFRNYALGGIYYCYGIMRFLMCTIDDRYDFDVYYAKQDECLSKFNFFPSDVGQLTNHPLGPWISLVGSARKGAPQDFIDATKRTLKHISHWFNGAMAGMDDLTEGEFKFYQGDIRTAETFIIRALKQAQEHKQFEIVHRALLYTMRVAIFQGDYIKAEQALRDMETLLNENEYPNQYITFDLALAWYYYILGLPEKISDWLKDKFEPYAHAYFIVNFGNQIKARFCYLTKDYPPLLTYMQEQKKREAILYGRVEMLAMEACVHYKLKNKTEALAILQEAYETALPNNILMPFIELGKDMRTLTAAALKESNNASLKSWLEIINRKASSYAKRQAHVIAEYKQANNIENGIPLSAREHEVLTDLSHGLSRAEIAAARSLSVNTIKMVINNIYSKLGAENLADLIRIAVEKKII